MARLVLKYTKSSIGYNERQKATIRALGFHKLNSVVEQPDNGSIRGMIKHVKHLVTIVKVVEEAGEQPIGSEAE